MDSDKENVNDDAKSTEERPISDQGNENFADKTSFELNNEENEEDMVVAEAPPPSLDLEKISEEIDGYITTLVNLKNGELEIPDVPIFVEKYAVLVESKISEYDSGENHVKWTGLTAEDSSTITRLSSLSNCLSSFSSEFKFAYTLNRIGGVLERTMAFIEEEFKILCDDFKIQDSDSTECEQEESRESFPGYSDENLAELVRLSTVMMKAGWIRTFKTFFTVHFPMEKKLAGKIFADYPSTVDTLFCSLSSSIMIQLLNFAEAVAMTKRAAEKLFKFLDIHESLRDVLPIAESLLPGSDGNLSLSPFHDQMVNAMDLLDANLEAKSKLAW